MTGAIPIPVLVVLLAGGCGSEKPIQGEPCAVATDCGNVGDAVCQAGQCLVFDEASGYGSAKVALSFGRDMYQVAASGYVHFFHPQMTDGRTLACEDILGGQLGVDDPLLNRLTSRPKYLVFNWAHGGTFFPDNLIQFIRPAEGGVAVAEGYSQLEGQGPRTALGCKAEQTIQREETAEFSIQLTAP
ncbi:MAG: hypothetical protein ACK2U9_00525 [Anaerolineae bacterium]